MCAQAVSIALKPTELILGIPDSHVAEDIPPWRLGESCFHQAGYPGRKRRRGWRNDSTTNGQYEPLVGSLAKSALPHGQPAVIPVFPHPCQVQGQTGCPPAPSPGPHSPDSMVLQVIFSNPDDSKILLLPLAAGEAATASELPSPSSIRANCYL